MANHGVDPNPPKTAYIAPIMGGFSFLRWAMGEDPVQVKAHALDAQIRQELANGYKPELTVMDAQEIQGVRATAGVA